MVDFDKLGNRAGDKGYPEIDDDWTELTQKQRDIIRALMKHPELMQEDIAEIADSDPSTVHKVIRSLRPETFNRYKGESVMEIDIDGELQNMDVDDNGLITVSTPLTMMVEVSIPQKDLVTATSAAISKDAITAAIDCDEKEAGVANSGN